MLFEQNIASIEGLKELIQLVKSCKIMTKHVKSCTHEKSFKIMQNIKKLSKRTY